MNRTTAERAILSVLADLSPNANMHRLEIGAAVFRLTGGTFAASILGDLLNRKLITRPVPDPGPKVHRYRITDAGRHALDLAAVMDVA